MKAVIQRVSNASVSIARKENGAIGIGLLIFLGIEDADTIEDVEWLSSKISSLRIFNDGNGVMNLSIKEVSGELLLISQFTLHASTKKGNRPSYIKSAKSIVAIPLYEKIISQLENDLGKKIQTGVFGANMQVKLINSGPVTLIIDTKNKE